MRQSTTLTSRMELVSGDAVPEERKARKGSFRESVVLSIGDNQRASVAMRARCVVVVVWFFLRL